MALRQVPPFRRHPERPETVLRPTPFQVFLQDLAELRLLSMRSGETA